MITLFPAGKISGCGSVVGSGVLASVRAVGLRAGEWRFRAKVPHARFLLEPETRFSAEEFCFFANWFHKQSNQFDSELN